MAINLKVIEVIFKWRKNEQNVLRNGEIDVELIPSKGDVLHFDNNRYKVLQRDFVSWKPQNVTLFVEKLYD